jgi:ABC-type bacteriocin/lantibiotic exporter with double-glycine peptidase domain
MGLFNFIKDVFHHFKRDILKAKLSSLLCHGSTFTVSMIFTHLIGHLHDVHYHITLLSFFMLIVATYTFTYLNEQYLKTLDMKALTYIMPIVKQHLFSLPLTVHNRYTSMELNKLLIDFETSSSTLLSTILSITGNLILSLMFLLFMFYCDSQLTAIYILIYSAFITFKLLRYPTYIKLMNNHMSSQANTASFLHESLMQIQKIRTANKDSVIHKTWLALLLSSKQWLEKVTTIEIQFSLIELVMPAMLLLIIYGFLYFSNDNTIPSALMPFLICAGQLALVFDKLSLDAVNLINVSTGLNRLLPLLAIPPEQSFITRSEIPFQGRIQLTDVTLQKPDNRSYILQNISLNIYPGSFTALIGPSGAGKSSIFKLILGLETGTSGTISIDNSNIKNVDMHSLRKQFGVVLQSTAIFSGTIFSNISTNTKISLDEAWALAESVGLADEINTMPMKMFTYISDIAGDSISGGQKQKILLARALATKPKILFLDEATSALDNHSQARILKHLDTLNITRVVIAHRHSTIVNADQIYYLEHGRISDSGTYNELVSRGYISLQNQ